MTKFKFLLSVLALLIVVSCASTPEEPALPPEEENIVETLPEEVVVTPEPIVPEKEIIVEEPVVEEPVIEEEIIEDIYVPEPLDETLIDNAKKEIFKAKEARAQTYYPQRLEDLNNKLIEVINIKDSDPDKARELLLQITDESKALTLDSLQALKIACINILEDKTRLLLNINADKYTPKEFAITQEQSNATKSAFENDDLTESLALYRTAYTSLTNLHNNLTTNLNYIEKLTAQIEILRVEGESIEVE